MEAAGTRYILHPSRNDTIKIWNLADLHLGNRAVAKDRLRKDIAEIAKDPLSFWIGGGDYGDFISTKDKRFDPDCMDPDVLDLSDMGCIGKAIATYVRDLLKPIAHKCLGLLFGNHEASYMRHEDQSDLHAWLCRELNVPNLRYSAIFDLQMIRGKGKPRIIPKPGPGNHDHRECSVHFLVHHGSGSAATHSGKTNRLKAFRDMTDADVIMVGHCHDARVMPMPRLSANADCSKIVERKRLGLMTGSYLRTYASGQTGYGEMKGYLPATLGAVAVCIHPQTGDLWSEVRA
jgi:hypothetical protein